MIKTFIAKSVDYRSFELFDESETSLGKIVYPKWYSTNAEIHINPKIYKIESKGFWTTSLEVFEYEKAVMKFKMSWTGNIVLIDFTNGERHFQINKEKWYNDVFEMKNTFVVVTTCEKFNFCQFDCDIGNVCHSLGIHINFQRTLIK